MVGLAKLSLILGSMTIFSFFFFVKSIILSYNQGFARFFSVTASMLSSVAVGLFNIYFYSPDVTLLYLLFNFVLFDLGVCRSVSLM